jgi:hypothetical protein
MKSLTRTVILLLATSVFANSQLRVHGADNEIDFHTSDLPYHHRVLSIVCKVGIPTFCICSEDALRSAVQKAVKGGLRQTVIRICSGTGKYASFGLAERVDVAHAF